MHVVILAGGGGTRLWPLSRSHFPKQFLQLGGQESLLKQTVLRFLNRPFVKTIIVSTNAVFEALVRKELEGLNVLVLVEPCRKNTAPAIGLSIRFLEEFCHLKPDEPVLILPSDHRIEPESVFLDYIQKGILAADKQIVTFGIRPTKPETGYGYLKIGERFDSFCYQVSQFVEKPDLERAKKFVRDPIYCWNSGVYAFTPAVFWAEAARFYPEICCLKGIPWDLMNEAFVKLQAISIDFALTERTKNVVVCPIPVTWSDIGCWESVYGMLEKDENQNVKMGNVVETNTKNCLIFGGKRVISTIGLEDLIIVDTEEGLLIAKRDAAQQVSVIS